MHPRNKGLIGAGVLSALLVFVANWEGTETKPYKDITGTLTVCNGSTEGIEDREYTLQECKEMSSKGLIRYGNQFLDCVDVPIPESILIAGTSFSWNVGIHNACNSRFVKLINQNKFYEACRAMAYGPTGQPAWSSSKGQYLKGLHNRRIAEMNKCLEDVKVP